MGYYMGDYYAGDPGFFSFLGKAARSFGGLIPGIGPAVQAVGGKLATIGAKPGVRKVVGAVAAHPVLSAAGAAGVAGAGIGALGSKMGSPAAAGMAHVRKARIPGMLRKRRHMRVTNPKALRRAIRRTSGFAKLAMRTIHIIHPRKRGRFGGFKKRRKR